MKPKYFKTILVGVGLILIVLTVALLSTSVSSAATRSPFIDSWYGVDTDGSDIRLVIAGKPDGPYQITSTDSYISFCNGEAGIIQGTGTLNPDNTLVLEANLKVVCFTTGDTLEIPTSFTYNPATDTLSGMRVIWSRANEHAAGCLPPPMGLTEWWMGDGNTEDSVSFRNGNFMGDATTGPGLVEDAFVLDGEGDSIEVPHDPALNFGTGDFTIDLWVNFNDLNDEQVLMEQWIQSDPYPQGWTLTKLSYQAVRLAIDDATRSEYDLDSDVLDLQPDTWYLFAATRRGQVITLYMNGAVIASADLDQLGLAPFNLDAPTSLKFGRRGDERGFYLDGRIDEAEIYNGTALTQAQIYELYSAGSFGKCKGYFKMTSIRAHPEWNNVDAWYWPEDKILQLTVDDPNTPRNPDVKMKKSGADKFAGSVWFDLAGYALKAGDIVTISDGVYSRTLTVSKLTITSVDVDLDMVYGTADPGVSLRLPYGPYGMSATAGCDGNWSADLREVGYDVQPGTMVIAEESDADGDTTSFEYWVPEVP